MDTVWTSGGIQAQTQMQGPLGSMTRISTLSDKWRSGVQSSHTGNTPRFSVWLFNIGRSRAWAIVLSTFFTWGKWILTKHEEWLSWGENHVMYRHCVVVMRSVWKVHRWLLLCKSETSPEETHTDTELQNHTPGPTHGPPTPIPTNPQHLNDVVASRYHRTKTLFFPGRSVSSLHLPPTPQVGIKHQGHSPTRASQRTPALSVRLYLSRVMIPEYLPCSLASLDSCDWREENSVRRQHLELRALRFLSCGLSPQITTTLYSSDSTGKQSLLLETLFHIRSLSFSLSNNNTVLFKKENFLLSKVPTVVNDALFLMSFWIRSVLDHRFILTLSPAK